ncbi:Oocyte zinc finger [Pelobates cultripes]|uniref:Oocyte zinc finger n=1 Tax=Pelobates cultripes TaxID=61616 RepID=A0AAD1VIW5_PELCU|nr:Oocyte zinc finger [Pelobates cultripes]
MNKNRNQKILDLTLEIIYLVTGEDYVVVKTNDGNAPHSRRPLVSEESYSINNPSTVPLLHSLTHDRNNDKKILELTNHIIHLLTGEVPIRCEDVTVYFSMEEWEYLDGHKVHYKDVMIENHQPFSSLDGSMGRPTHKGFQSPTVTLDDANEYKSDLSRNKIQKTQSNSVQNEEVDSSLSGEEKIKDISIPSEHIQTSIYIKEEPTSSEEENLTDIYTPARHTNTECPFTQFREESATTKTVRLLDSDIYMPTDHTKTENTSTCIKEEPSSSEELTDTEICTPPTEHSWSECTSAHIKEELISWEERDGVIRDLYTATKPAWTENASILKEELASCKERNVTDVEMYANTQHIQILDILINTEEGAMKTNIKPITIVMDNQYEKSDISVCQQNSNSGKELYTCSVCQKCFTSNLEFTNHQESLIAALDDLYEKIQTDFKTHISELKSEVLELKQKVMEGVKK